MDSLEFDIKRALVTSPRVQLQWKELKDELFKKHKEYTEDTFKTTLHRKLKKLRLAGDVDKKVLGHQEVFYFVPKKRLKPIKEELDRETAHRLFDEVWQSFTPEQRKRELRYLLSQRVEMVSIFQYLSKVSCSFLEELINVWISELENPTENMKAKHSPDEREQLLQQFKDLAEEVNVINQPFDQVKINENELRAHLHLYHKFLDNVVNPVYSGNWNEAIMDLMQKAVREREEMEKKEGISYEV